MTLPEYLRSVQKKPFCWGEHDCLTFTNKCIEIYCGFGYADDWIGEYKCALSARRWYLKMLKKYGYDCITDAIDDRLTRVDVKVPVDGSLVARKEDGKKPVVGRIMGIYYAGSVVFLSSAGLQFTLIKDDDIFWSVA